ncbi:hypothetical protein BDQ17DRAFT_1398141 [Cyathus striatus]|nr:hypothetical protein BDQ17DRAFT_1398141 [Cyathus striatus]
MGFTGLARWVNAPAMGMQEVRRNIELNHNGLCVAKWNLSVKSYRSTLGQNSSGHSPSERILCTLTMDNNVFVLLEDPMAPTRAEVLAVAPPGQERTYLQGPSHFRTTFLTLRPPGALEQLLAQLKARWVPVRQGATAGSSRGQTGGQQLIIDGHTFSIGTDWLVRIGNVVLAGGLIKGMLLEAEYLPLPVLPTSNGTSEMLSNLILSILPNVRDAKTVAVTISDTQWEDVLWEREEEGKDDATTSPKPENEVYSCGFEDIPDIKRGDWVGIDRDRRSAYLIVGALRSEGIL